MYILIYAWTTVYANLFFEPSAIKVTQHNVYFELNDINLESNGL